MQNVIQCRESRADAYTQDSCEGETGLGASFLPAQRVSFNAALVVAVLCREAVQTSCVAKAPQHALTCTLYNILIAAVGQVA